MFQVTRGVEYAVLLLIGILEAEASPVSLSFLAGEKGLPFKYLEKIASKLKKEHILQSSPGINGGYYFKKKPADISLQDIVFAVEGRRGLVSCINGKCSLEKGCFHKKVWFDLQTKLLKELKNVKLTDLVD
jgi:Rrf2 family protein